MSRDETAPDASPKRRLTTVIAADICGYARLAESDEVAAVRSVNLIYALFERAVAKHRGRVFNKAGDGFYAEFPSVSAAILAALNFAEEVRGRDTLSPGNPGVKVRTGVHVGDVVEQDGGDLLGHGVNVAARLQGEAQENGVLVSSQVVNLVDGKIDVRFVRRGSLNLKNMEQPITTFDVLAGAHPPVIGMALLRRLRRLGPRTLFVTVAACIVAAVNIVILNSVLESRDQRVVAESASQRASARTADINALSSVVAKGAANSSGIVAVRAAIDALLASKDPQKATVIDLIRSDRVADAISALESLYRLRRADNAPTPELITLLHEIGALSLYLDSDRSRDAYREIDTLSGGKDATAILRLAEFAMDVTQADVAAKYYRRLTDLAAVTQDQQAQSQALIGEGRANTMLGNLEIGRLKLFDALAIAEKHGLQVEKARALYFLGSGYALEGDQESAVRVRLQANEIERSLTGGDRDDLRIAYSHMGVANSLRYLEKQAAAIDHYRSAIDILEQVGDTLALARVLFNLGGLYNEMGDPIESEKTFNRVLLLAQSLRDQENLQALTLHELALIARQRGDVAAACKNYKAAMTLYTKSAHEWPELERDQFETLCA